VCRQSLPKRELLRIVRTPEGAILFDPTGKRSGRGAYLCRQRSCWEQAIKKRSLSHALKASPTPEEAVQLMDAVGPLLTGQRSETGMDAPVVQEAGA